MPRCCLTVRRVRFLATSCKWADVLVGVVDMPLTAREHDAEESRTAFEDVMSFQVLRRGVADMLC